MLVFTSTPHWTHGSNESFDARAVCCPRSVKPFQAGRPHSWLYLHYNLESAPKLQKLPEGGWNAGETPHANQIHKSDLLTRSEKYRWLAITIQDQFLKIYPTQSSLEKKTDSSPGVGKVQDEPSTSSSAKKCSKKDGDLANYTGTGLKRFLLVESRTI